MADKQTVEFEQPASMCCGLDVYKKEIVATVDGEGLQFPEFGRRTVGDSCMLLAISK